MQEGNYAGGYNALNAPVVIGSSVTWATGSWMWFGYDPLGRCVKRVFGPGPESGTALYFYYEGWNLIQEGPAFNDASRNYVHGARVDEIVKQITPPNQWERYFHYDARGHCTLQTDAFGNIAEQYEYDAFGQPYFFDGAGNNIGYSPWGNRFLFTGREWLSELKLYDFRNRLYQPELGRFLQPDPKEFAAGDYNLYRYCHNDPVNKSDPTGLAEDEHEGKANIPEPSKDGKPLPPPIPLPPNKDGTPNRWVPVRGTGNRPVKWKPERPVDVPGSKGGQPGASWDPEHGHYDWDHGDGTRDRVLPDGRLTAHNELDPSLRPLLGGKNNDSGLPPWLDKALDKAMKSWWFWGLLGGAAASEAATP